MTDINNKSYGTPCILAYMYVSARSNRVSIMTTLLVHVVLFTMKIRISLSLTALPSRP